MRLVGSFCWLMLQFGICTSPCHLYINVIYTTLCHLYIILSTIHQRVICTSMCHPHVSMSSIHQRVIYVAMCSICIRISQYAEHRLANYTLGFQYAPVSHINQCVRYTQYTSDSSVHYCVMYTPVCNLYTSVLSEQLIIICTSVCNLVYHVYPIMPSMQ